MLLPDTGMFLCTFIYICIYTYALTHISHISHHFTSFYQPPAYKTTFSVVVKFTCPARTSLEACGLIENPGDFLPNPFPHRLSHHSWRRCLQKELPLKVILLSNAGLAHVEMPFPEEIQHRAKLCPCNGVQDQGGKEERAEGHSLPSSLCYL